MPTQFTPDYRNILSVMRNERPARLPVYEHVINFDSIENITGKKFAGLINSKDPADLAEFFRHYCAFWKDMTYDTVSYEVCIGAFIGGSAISGGAGKIQTPEDFNAFPWEEVPKRFWEYATPRYDALCAALPSGMKAIGGVGNGIVRPGMVSVSIGTSGVVFACSDKPMIDKVKRGSFSLCHSVPDKWAFLGCTLAAGGSFKWLRDNLFADKRDAMAKNGMDVYDHMTSLAADSKPAAQGLVYLPYLNGEGTPIVDSNARGTFFGLSYMHGIGDICRSVMEGVTYSLRDSVEILREFGLEISEVRALGGGAKSDLWRQMQADIYNTDVVTMNIDEGPAAGAAIMAAVGAKHFNNIEEACGAILKPVSTKMPISKNVEQYDEFYMTYKQIYKDLKDTFKQQAALVKKYS